MKGLPRNIKVKKNPDGSIQFYTRRTRMLIPLWILEKREELTPTVVNYLNEYKSRLNKDKEGKITDTKTLNRIEAILSKKKLEKDSILDKDMRQDFQIARDKKQEEARKKHEEEIKKEEEKKNAKPK